MSCPPCVATAIETVINDMLVINEDTSSKLFGEKPEEPLHTWHVRITVDCQSVGPTGGPQERIETTTYVVEFRTLTEVFSWCEAKERAKYETLGWPVSNIVQDVTKWC